MTDLTPGQLDVLRLVAEGLTDRVVGERLHISESAVKARKTLAFRALGAANGAQAVAVAYRRGILVPDGIDAQAVAMVLLAERLGYRLALVPDGARTGILQLADALGYDLALVPKEAA